MAECAIEKVYGERTLSEVGDEYLQMSVPKDVVDDERFGLEPGEKVDVRGVISGDEAYVRFEARK